MKKTIIALATSALVAGTGMSGTATQVSNHVNGSSAESVEEKANDAQPSRAVTGRNTSPSRALWFFSKKNGYGTPYFVGAGQRVNNVQSVLAPYRCTTIVNGIPRWEGTYANSMPWTISLNATTFNCG